MRAFHPKQLSFTELYEDIALAELTEKLAQYGSTLPHYLLAVVDALEIPLERRPKFLDEVQTKLLRLLPSGFP